MAHEVVADMPDVEARKLRVEVRRRAMAANSVWLTPHALEQAECRGIDLDLVQETLQEGFLDGLRTRLQDGRPAVRLLLASECGRVCGVVATLRGERTVEVVTAMWWTGLALFGGMGGWPHIQGATRG